MKKIIMLLIFSLLIISCQENSETKLALDWYPNSNHGGVYTALEGVRLKLDVAAL